LALMASDGLSLVQQLMEKLDEEEFTLAMIVARLMWLRHNNFLFRGEFSAPSHLFFQAMEGVEWYMQANLGTERPEGEIDYLSLCWFKPPRGIKLNWDAVMDKDNKKMGVGVIVRDCSGIVLVAMEMTVVMTFFFFLYKTFIKHKTSHHSDMTTCRSANITYTLHIMYLIFRVISSNGIIIILKIIMESTSKNNMWSIQKSHISV